MFTSGDEGNGTQTRTHDIGRDDPGRPSGLPSDGRVGPADATGAGAGTLTGAGADVTTGRAANAAPEAAATNTGDTDADAMPNDTPEVTLPALAAAAGISTEPALGAKPNATRVSVEGKENAALPLAGGSATWTDGNMPVVTLANGACDALIPRCANGFTCAESG